MSAFRKAPISRFFMVPDKIDKNYGKYQLGYQKAANTLQAFILPDYIR
jgi:hypothetical protein